MTTKNFEPFADGDDCTGLFRVWTGSVPESWACAGSSEGARSMIRVLLGYDGTPLEGGVRYLDGVMRKVTVDFASDFDGTGLTLTYMLGEADELGFTEVCCVRVYRATAYDRAEVAAC